MKTTIIIKKGKEKEEIKVNGFFLIASDPNKIKGIKFFSSEMKTSVPRMLGWVEWARQWLFWCANVNFSRHFTEKSNTKKK